MLLFTLVAGAVADRVDKRRTLMALNVMAALLALLLAWLTWRGDVQIWHVALVAFLAGSVNAFDIPVRQSFNVEMVGRRDLPNAIALNSSAFNGARVAGPMAGGFLLGAVGIAGCFLVNAFSYVALIFNLARMNTPRAETPANPPRLGDIWDGWCFVRKNPTLWMTVILVAWTSFWAMSYSPLLPVFAKDIFLSNERGFAFLAAFNGVGALASALALAAAGSMRHRGKRLLLGALLFSLSVVAFGACNSLVWGCFILVLAGWFLLTFLMTANTLVQTIAPDELRGRVFSVYSLALIGTAPLGALAMGGLARVLGASGAVRLGGGISAVFAVWIFLCFRSLWKEK
jgi:MFS family permease